MLILSAEIGARGKGHRLDEVHEEGVGLAVLGLLSGGRLFAVGFQVDLGVDNLAVDEELRHNQIVNGQRACLIDANATRRTQHLN